MPTIIRETATYELEDFDPAAIAYLIGEKVIVTVEAQTANGNYVVRRTAVGVLAGAQRWQQFEDTGEAGSYWPRIYFQNGFEILLRPETTGRIVINRI